MFGLFRKKKTTRMASKSDMVSLIKETVRTIHGWNEVEVKLSNGELKIYSPTGNLFIYVDFSIASLNRIGKLEWLRLSLDQIKDMRYFSFR